MPVYTYECPENKVEFDASHSIKEELTECLYCKDKGLPFNHKPKKLISLSSFQLIGEGWAKDNYSKK